VGRPRFSLPAFFALLLLATGKAYGASDVHRAAGAFDLHVDLPADFDASPPVAGRDRFSVAKAQEGGLSVVGLSVFAPQGADTADGRAAARAEAEARDGAIARLVAQSGGRVVFARSVADIDRLRSEGKLAVVKTVVNGGAFAATPAEIGAWADRGVRIFGLVHAGHNALADSSRPALPRGEALARWGGLSPAGRAAIAELNRRGVAVDVSQLSTDAFRQAVELSRAPVLATHSAARALVDVGRNLSDAELDLLKRNGGVVGIVAFSAYLRPDAPETRARLAALQKEYGLTSAGGAPLTPDAQAAYTKAFYAIRGAEPRATVEQLVDHIDYAVKRIGIEHVGIASDFNHGGGVIGWGDTAEAPAVTAELVKRGYSPADIARLWRGNALRVLAAAEAAGAAASASR
jgi:microsomal dipeptidase-like Zn-dependent dipeptidase